MTHCYIDGEERWYDGKTLHHVHNNQEKCYQKIWYRTGNFSTAKRAENIRKYLKGEEVVKRAETIWWH